MFDRDYFYARLQELDRNSLIYEGKQEGRKEGFAIGFEIGFKRGWKEGFKEGMKIGRRKVQLEVAKRMREAGMDDSLIATATKLSLDEIQKL